MELIETKEKFNDFKTIETLKIEEPKAFTDLRKNVLSSVKRFEKRLKEGNINAEKGDW